MSTVNFNAILFDLDGTLLQVEMRQFIPRYVAGFHNFCRDLVEFERLQQVMRSGIRLLLETVDGARSNEDRLFAFVAASLELDEKLLRERFTRFRLNGFEELSDVVRPIAEAPSLLEHCRRAGIPLVLATNPVFPRSLIEARCHWAGIDLDHFDHLTCFENSRHCKPQPGYFLDIAAEVKVEPETCLMVGNDTSHDLAATEAGMTTWLVDSFLLERKGPTWEPDYRGNHRQLLSYLREHVTGRGGR